MDETFSAIVHFTIDFDSSKYKTFLGKYNKLSGHSQKGLNPYLWKVPVWFDECTGCLISTPLMVLNLRTVHAHLAMPIMYIWCPQMLLNIRIVGPASPWNIGPQQQLSHSSWVWNVHLITCFCMVGAQTKFDLN